MKKTFEIILQKAIEIVTSNHMKALYWGAFAMIVAGLMDLTSQALTSWDPHNLITIGAGLVFARITKELNKRSQGK